MILICRDAPTRAVGLASTALAVTSAKPYLLLDRMDASSCSS